MCLAASVSRRKIRARLVTLLRYDRGKSGTKQNSEY